MTLALGNKDDNCYVCGSENPAGLHVTFVPHGESGSRATFTVQPGHVGWPGLLHGGLLFTLMDEALGWALYYHGLRGVTAKTEIRFRSPVPVGTQLVITGSIEERNRNLARMRANVLLDNGSSEKVAELTATMYLLRAPEVAESSTA
jgi:acyl-coenzyme A thioesterase PaaI-like protein